MLALAAALLGLTSLSTCSEEQYPDFDFYSGSERLPDASDPASPSGGQTGSTDPVVTAPKLDVFFQATTGGEVRFATNQTSRLGAAWWWSDRGKSYTADMHSVKSLVRRDGGRANAGFGLVFAPQSSAMKGSYENFFRVLITVEGRYSVFKMGPGGLYWESVLPWGRARNLRQGYGVENQILITHDLANRLFRLSFNGIEESYFPDGGVTGGLAGGFYVKVAADERFPEEPADLSFRQELPVALP